MVKPLKKLVNGKLYRTPRGTVGRACRHPLHAQGRVSYIWTVAGDLLAVCPDKMRTATAAEVRKYRQEALRCP